MNVRPYDIGACGLEQLMYAGRVTHDMEGASEGAVLCELPANIIVTGAVVVIGTAFTEAGTLTIGGNDSADDIVTSGAVTATEAKTTVVDGFSEYRKDASIKVKLGGSPTDGVADVYLYVVRIPE